MFLELIYLLKNKMSRFYVNINETLLGYSASRNGFVEGLHEKLAYNEQHNLSSRNSKQNLNYSASSQSKFTEFIN